MSTSEKFEVVLQACPCGRSRIMRAVISYDNPWSGADVSYWIDCDKCSGDWEINSTGTSLTLRSSLLPWKKANQVSAAARIARYKYLRGLAAQYFKNKNLLTKKAGHEFLVDLGIFKGSYRSYLHFRKTQAIHENGGLDCNPRLVGELIATYGDRTTYQTLDDEAADADKASEKASALIVRQKVAQ